MTADTHSPQDNSADSKDSKKSKSFEPVLLKGEIKIFPDKRLPLYDRGILKAYAAQGIGGVKAFAIICEKNIVPQAEIVHKYAGIITPQLPKLLACGVVDWTPSLRECFVFVYEDKLGTPLSYQKNPNALGYKPDLVISTIFRNILEVVRAMRDKGIPHGNICPQNIYDGGSDSLENTMLGEMLSTPSGYCQPVLYETIPRGLSHPLGKGIAEISDDIYALGVTLASLLKTHDHIDGLSDEMILQQKMEIGSFNFIVGKNRLPPIVLEFLRGTLNDDFQLRWSFDDIITWAEGRRVNPKNTGLVGTLKASRPIDFGKQKFLKPQMLAVTLPKDSAATLSMIENGELYLWLNRSIQDKQLEQRYDEALSEAKKDLGGTNYADKLASVMAIALEPDYPVMYKGLTFNVMGFGNLVVNALQTKNDISTYVDIIKSGIISFWNKSCFSANIGIGEVITRIDNSQKFLGQTAIGSGIERSVYYLSPMCPCLSEKLDKFYVRTAEDYLNALEKMSGQKDRPEWFLDRHIVAFLSVRDKSIIEPFLSDISATERYRHRKGALKILAAIQKRDKMPALPGVGIWMAGMMNLLIDRFHDREKRQRIAEQLEKIKGQGNLDKILMLFDSFEEIHIDTKNFSEMIKYNQNLRKEYFVLENELENNKKFGVEAGQQTASLVSGIIAGIVITVYLIFTLARGGIGGS